MKEKKEKKRWGLIAFMVVIMLGTTFSFVYYGFAPEEDTVKYNGIKFTNHGNPSQGKFWVAQIKGIEAAFSFLPNEVENINSTGDFSGELHGKLEIDSTSDVNSTYKESIALAQHQMGLTLESYSLYLRKGFIAPNQFNLPLITCSESTSIVPVVYFKSGNATGIHVENHCIIAEASSNADVIKIKDRLLYGMLGVMK